MGQKISIVCLSLFRTLDLDTYPLSNFIRPQCAERAKRGRGKPVLIMHNFIIGFLANVFTPYLPNAVVLAKSPRFYLALVALKLLVSLITRLVACYGGPEGSLRASKLLRFQIAPLPNCAASKLG